jgi:signal transduction histidine kinase
MNLHVAIPEEDLFPGLHHRRLFMLMLAVGAVIAASWGILDLHHRFVRPMRALAKDSGPACDDWASPEIDSDIWEIQHLDQRLRKGGQAIQERNQLLLQVEQSQRADSIAMMAPGIIHDVNNHLSLVLGQLALCQKLSKNHPDLQPRLQVAEGAALRCSEVLRGLLDYSRPGPGGRELLNLNAAVQDACGLLQRVLGKAIQLEEELGPVPLVFGEPVKLQQVLINLGMNARDAMPGGGVLRFRTFRRGDHACLEVEDTGCGMSPETQRRVFEPFFTTKEVGKGTGLGLAMVSNIVSAHGGTIDLHSEPGKGTRFHLEFPDSLRK